jgi:O-antigen/teichoic acid export membrane protein
VLNIKKITEILRTKELINIKHLIVSYIFRYLIGLGINILIIRQLGQVNFGIFSYVNSLNGIFGIISTFGLQTVIITKLLNAESTEKHKILSNGFILSLLTGVFAGILQLSFILNYNSNEKEILILTLINTLIFFFDTFKILTFYFESEVDSKKVTKITNISLIICTLYRLVVLYFNFGLYHIAFSYVLDYIITAILLYKITPKYIFNLFDLKFEIKIILNLFKEALPYLFSGLFISFFMKIDLIVIKNLLTNRETGIFAVSVRLTEIWYFIPGMIQSSFFPTLYERKINQHLFNLMIIKLYKILILFSIFIIFINILFGKYLILNLFGENYLPAYYPLIIHIWSLLFVSLSVIRNSYLFAHNLSKIFFYIHMIGAILNLMLCIILIKYFGLIGASLATLFSYFIVSYVCNFFFKPLRNEVNNIHNAILRPFNF